MTLRKISLSIYVVAILAFLASCGGNKNEGFFTVSGELTNSNGEKIYLSRLNSNSITPTDSAMVDEYGKFTLKGVTNEPRFYILRISPKEKLDLLIDSAQNIKITGDYKKLLKTCKIDGSPESNLLLDLDLHIAETITKIDSLGTVYKANMNKLNIDSLKKELDQEFFDILGKQKKFSTSFIEKNITSRTCLLALAQQFAPNSPVLSIKDDIEWFDRVDKSLYASYPNSENTKALHDYLENKRSNPTNAAAQAGEIAVGNLAPDVVMKTPEGQTLALSSFRGKYVLLDFWASWCKPCREENPNVVKNYWKYKTRKFEILQVSLDQNKDAWTNAIKQDQLTWNHVSDLKFWQSAAAQLYGVKAIPSNFLIDPDGKVIAVNLRGEALGNKLKEVFGF